MGNRGQLNLFNPLCSSLAPPGAKSPEERKQEFAELEMDAKGKAEKLQYVGKAHENAWAELLPVLDKIQDCLSIRGKDHKWHRCEGLPSWTEWWTKFQKDHDFDASLRRVQKKLKQFRDRTKAREDQPEITEEQKAYFRALRTQLTRGEKRGKNFSDVVVAFILRRISAPPIQQIVARLTTDDKAGSTEDKGGSRRKAPQTSSPSEEVPVAKATG
ncbi:MAG: hypothetical protein ACLGSD_11015 [Acidobacteriota bacterium]